MHALPPRKLDLKQRWTVFLILSGFFVLYASISLVNHWMFRTFGWDLAYFNSALYDYSQFRLNRYDLWWTDLRYTLGDHFEPIMFLIGPLRYLFGQYTLLLVQMGAILWGGYGAFCFVRHRTDHVWLPHLAMVHYLSIFGIYSALAFDYHNNVVGAMFLPWVVHFFDRGQFRWAGLCLLLLCMSKENMALWGVFIMGAMALQFRRDRSKLGWALGMMGFAGVYFVMVMKVVMPAFQPEGMAYIHFRYSVLGESASEALKTLFTRPWFVLETMFTNHRPEESYLDRIKMELYEMVLLAGGWAMILRPQYLLMALPIIGQKVFSDKPGTWGINNHYSIELVPVIFLALFSVLLKWPALRWKGWVAGALAMLCLGSTIFSFSHRETPFYRQENQNLFSPVHWKQNNFYLMTARNALSLVPDDVPVSASNTLLPHLSMRDQVYMFPKIENAEAVLVLRQFDCYPPSPEEVEAKVAEMRASGDWEVIFEEGPLILFRRI